VSANIDTVDAALAPWGTVTHRRRAQGGIRNDVFHVVIDGQRRVARLGRRSGPDLEWELELLACLHDEGFNVPAVIHTRDGRRCVGSTVVFDYVAGRRPRTATDWTDVARYLSDLHSATVGWKQRPSWRSTHELPGAAHSGLVDLATMPPLVVDVCDSAFAPLRPGTSVIHGDPNSRNVIVGPRGVVLIDWDEARVDDPNLDLAAIGLGDDRAAAAHSAWEAAACWRDAPTYACRRLERAMRGA